MTEQGPVWLPKDVLEQLEAVRRYTRAEVLDIGDGDGKALPGRVDRQARARIRSGPSRRLREGRLNPRRRGRTPALPGRE